MSLDNSSSSQLRTSDNFQVLIRVAGVATPLPMLCPDRCTVADLKRLFLHHFYSLASSPPEHSASEPTPASAAERASASTCRFVCRGQELLDEQYVRDCVRTGDHVHAIVREVPIAERHQRRASSATSIRAEAQHWVDELRRLLEQRRNENPTPQTQDPHRSGVPSSGIGESHQQVSRLVAPSFTVPPPTTPPAEAGGLDDRSEVVVEDAADPLGGQPGATLLHAVNSVATQPLKVLVGVAFGFFTSILAMLLITTNGKECSLAFRFGTAIGLMVNILLAMALQTPILTPFR